MKRTLRLAMLVTLLLGSASVAEGQGPIQGSTMRAGAADSLYRAFVVFLRGQDYTLQRADSAHWEVTFLSPRFTDEPLRVRFSQRRDSTEIAAQGAKGGMLATLAGLDAVRRFMVSLDSGTVAPDSVGRAGSSARMS